MIDFGIFEFLHCIRSHILGLTKPKI